MSGIYIHIPFCKKACHYCNFHFSTSLSLKEEVISAICREISLRHDYLEDKYLQSIYFGGGTPSLLYDADLKKIFSTLSSWYHWNDKTEITLESNPDDLSTEKLQIFKNMGINRLSIGIQSFFDADLHWMNRAHNADEALQSISKARDAGFENITIDLIYGSPTTSNAMWQENISRAIELQIPHISSYCLTVEDKTVLSHHINKGLMKPPDIDQANFQFGMLMDSLTGKQYEHYEISNFALVGHQAVHNTNYWKKGHYLGLGPSAHSYNGISRSWNISHNKKYTDAILSGQLPAEMEILTANTIYNEYIMTGLRTQWGVNLLEINQIGEMYRQYFIANITPYLNSGEVLKKDNVYTLSREGKYFADRIAMDLFYVD